MSKVSEPVEFVINCFERNIDEVTAPGFLAQAVQQHCYPFAVRTLLINNVTDRARAEAMANDCLSRGEIDRFCFVDDLRERSFKQVGLTEKDFGRFLHWSDCCVVALVMDGPDLLCYVDVDLTLRPAMDWITPALLVMRHDRRVAVGNPAWVMPNGYSPVAAEADETGEGFILGYGFSDMIFLARRSQLARPLLRRWIPLWLECPATMRFPGAPLGLFFEQIAEGYLRLHHLRRVTVLGTAFEPIPISDYPVTGLLERIRRKRNSLVTAGLVVARRRWPRLITSPRLRYTGLLDPEFQVDR
ncbi:MAG: hypothetical protein WBH64_01690 [Propionicimonas sp.]